MGGVKLPLIRGDVWEAEFDPVRGREQAGRRPALIVSSDTFNQGPSQLVSVVPITTRDRGILTHVPILPPEGGLSRTSFAMSEQLRMFSVERLLRRRGSVSPRTLAAVEGWIRDVLDL